ncbi:MAG: right-handed parallel beta-helix repeat-containing protein [Sedimentisphaerales bacterium]
MPKSSQPALDAAAKALAEGRLDAASREFQTISEEPSAPACMRGLAMLGLAEVALARKDFDAADAIWKRLADDATMLRFHRETARRLIAETKRIQQGLPARDPDAYRVQLPTLPEPAVTLHVAPMGNGAADGSATKPFRTLEGARNAVRKLKEDHGGSLPKGGVRIEVAGGNYAIQRTFNLTSEDSGTAEAPIIYQAQSGQSPVFRGGKRITKWRPISNALLRDKLEPSVRDKVLESDLKAAGVTDWGDATDLRHRPELFANGRPQTLARWPNEGFVETGDILGKDTFKVWNRIEGCRDGKFRYLGDRPGWWRDEPDVRLYGYWFWDWYEQYQKVGSIDADAHTFTLLPPYSNYGYRKGQRYYAVNVFRELDSPGEWYLDRRTGMIYWLPPKGIEVSKAEVVLSMLDEPFIILNNVEHVTLLGLTFQEGRGDGIHVDGGADCLVAGCTIRRFGGDAIIVQGGRHHGVFGCMMNTLGCGGANVIGGDREKLTPGRHYVENCTVSNISRIKRTYTPAVHLDGCGNRVAHNLFEKIPSSALRIDGNEHLIELNVIRDVVQESDDQGGLDMWGNPLARGVVIRWNQWSDIRGGTANGAAGVRLDDMISGVVIHGNIFERCGAVKFGGVQIHGGQENVVDGNLFVDCFAGISFSRWGQKRWLESIQRFLPQAGRPPYSSRYPELAGLKENADVNIVTRNLFSHCESVFLRDGGIERTALNAATARAIAPESVSEDKSAGSEQLKQILFEKIPSEEMGPYPHPWRIRQ